MSTDYRQILVHMDPTERSAKRLEIARQLAARHGAALAALTQQFDDGGQWHGLAVGDGGALFGPVQAGVSAIARRLHGHKALRRGKAQPCWKIGQKTGQNNEGEYGAGTGHGYLLRACR